MEKKFFEIWRIWAIFSMKIPLYIGTSKSYFLGRILAENRQWKKRSESAIHKATADAGRDLENPKIGSCVYNQQQQDLRAL